jgi:Cu-Zn family superoxide dismutase
MKDQLKKQLVHLTLFAVTTLITSSSFYSCKKKKEDPKDENKTAVATIQPTFDTIPVSGRATFTQKNNEEVTLTLDIKVPSRANQSVAVHIHEMADCGNNGSMAMAHWNPTGANHGKWGSASFHIGDIGNISLDATGHAIYTLTTNLWNINGDDASRNVVGRSIIVHAGVDDYTGASGNSGTRIGCAGIQ